MRTWKIGALAKETGITVRTLHHYDQIGLLSPSARTSAGYRLYGEADIRRLHQVFSLRQLGFTLEQIRECLSMPEFTPGAILELHLARLKDQIEAQERLHARLTALAGQLKAAGPISMEQFTQTMEMMTMIEKYYTPDQLKQLDARREAVGEARIKEVEAEWPGLIAKVQAAMARGTPATDPGVQRLARRWMELVHEMTNGDPAINRAIMTMYREEPTVREQSGIDPKLFEYIGAATKAAKAAE